MGLKRADNSQTRENIRTFCAQRRIVHRLQFSDDLLDNLDRSRAFAVDPDGLLMRAITGNIGKKPGQWSKDGGQNHNANGKKVLASYRSRTSPSLQVCVVAARGGQYPEVLEIDLDEYSPFEDPLQHAGEVIHNAVWRKRTDPKKIAAMLAQSGSGPGYSVTRLKNS